MTALERMETILADPDTECRNARVRAWYARDRQQGQGQPFPTIANALKVAPEDLARRWYEATAAALGGPGAKPITTTSPAGSA